MLMFNNSPDFSLQKESRIFQVFQDLPYIALHVA